MWRLWQLFEVNSHFVINKKIELKRLHIDFSLYNDKVFQKLAKSTSLKSSPCQVDVPVRARTITNSYYYVLDFVAFTEYEIFCDKMQMFWPRNLLSLNVNLVVNHFSGIADLKNLQKIT